MQGGILQHRRESAEKSSLQEQFSSQAIENANDRNVDELQPKNTEISVFDKILELPRFFFGKREGKLPTEQS